MFSFIWLHESCKKEKIDYEGLWDCHESQNYDSMKLASKLVGSWKWTTQYCYWDGMTIKADKDVKVTFTSAGTFSVIENSVVVAEGNWKPELVVNTSFYLDLDPFTEYLYGSIVLCDNEVLFYSSAVDGCDYLFVRM